MSPIWSFFMQLGLTLVVLGVCGVEHVTGAIILSENFEGPAVGANVTTSNSVFNGNVTPGTGGVLQVTDEATASIAFSGSKFLRYVDAATNSATMRSRFTIAPLSQSAIAGLFQLSWDYYEPNAVISGTATQFRVLLSQGDITINANRAVDLLFNALNDGTATSGFTTNWNDGLTNIAAYNTNSLVHFDVVGNVGPSTTYSLGDLPTQTIDLYMNGILVANNLIFRGPNDGGSAITGISEFGIGYSSSANRVQNVFVDNLVLSDEITLVPEPATCLLAVLALVSMGGIRPRRSAE